MSTYQKHQREHDGTCIAWHTNTTQHDGHHQMSLSLVSPPEPSQCGTDYQLQ
ncbi:hypothetical protein DPMN_024467 [Dreissena polymorpha]|uniref:Uncharacterized protein n=1 Tax=Dreissena polymorpha TaxID=45954 RepID=A0A9D4LNY7_DREPO|nr:hypothetical protein DPMN_024467 [Dreissena polymorpha]